MVKKKGRRFVNCKLMFILIKTISNLLKCISEMKHKTSDLPVLNELNIEIFSFKDGDCYGNTGCGVFKRGVQN